MQRNERTTAQSPQTRGPYCPLQQEADLSRQMHFVQTTLAGTIRYHPLQPNLTPGPPSTFHWLDHSGYGDPTILSVAGVYGSRLDRVFSIASHLLTPVEPRCAWVLSSY